MDINLFKKLTMRRLYYFWELVKQGTQEDAAGVIDCDSSTISGNKKHLEEALHKLTGEKVKLFKKEGRINKLSRQGQILFDECEKLIPILNGIKTKLNPNVLHIGITPAFPKYLTYYFLYDLLKHKDGFTIKLIQNDIKGFLDPLKNGYVDIVLADGPPPEDDSLYDHIVYEGDSNPVIVADPKLIRTYKLKHKTFPDCLNGVPFILPPEGSTLRKAIDLWIIKHNLEPKIIAETFDRLLLVMLAQDGLAAVGISSVAAPTACHVHGLKIIGKVDTHKDNFFAIKRKTEESHPAFELIREKFLEYKDSPPKPK